MNDKFMFVICVYTGAFFISVYNGNSGESVPYCMSLIILAFSEADRK